MREVLLDQYMAIEASHLRNSEDTDGTETTCSNRKNFTVCNVSTKVSICCTLKTEEGDISRNDVSFESSVGNFDRKRTSHDLLVFHLAEGKLACSCISAVESHECIFQCVVCIFSFDVLVVQILRYGVVDVEKSYCIFTYNSSDELGKCTVDIYFTRYRNTFCSQTAVYVARYETKLCLECRPAFTGDCYEFTISFVIFNPVKQCQLILSKFCKDFRFFITSAKLCFHFFYNVRNTSVTFMFVECFEQVKLGVLFDLYTKVVKWFDWCITSKEVQWTWSKADDLQVVQCIYGTSNWYELMDHVCTILSSSNRILRDVSFYIAEF